MDISLAGWLWIGCHIISITKYIIISMYIFFKVYHCMFWLHSVCTCHEHFDRRRHIAIKGHYRCHHNSWHCGCSSQVFHSRWGKDNLDFFGFHGYVSIIIIAMISFAEHGFHAWDFDVSCALLHSLHARALGRTCSHAFSQEWIWAAIPV